MISYDLWGYLEALDEQSRHASAWLRLERENLQDLVIRMLFDAEKFSSLVSRKLHVAFVTRYE